MVVVGAAMRSSHARGWMLCAAVAALVIGGCQNAPVSPPAVPPGSPAPTPGAPVAGGAATAAAPVAVRVGYFPNITHAPAVLGFSKAEGAFEQALVGRARLATTVFNAGPAAMEALHARALDICFVGPTPAINAYARGGDVVLVANVANGGSSLVARQDTGIKTVSDLVGKKIAVPQLGNTQDAMLRHLLRREKIDLVDQGGKTTVAPIENPDVQRLFVSEQLDAACVPEPWGTRLEIENGATVVLDWKAIWREGDYPVTVLVVRKAFLEEHRDIVATFVNTLTQLTERLNAGAQSEATALNAELKVLTGKELKPEVIKRALERLAFSTTPNSAALQAMAQIMKDVGYAKSVPDLGGLVDPGFTATATAPAAR